MLATRRWVVGASMLLFASCAAPATMSDETAVETGPLVRGISYVGVSVSDLDASVEFYRSTGLMEVAAGSLSGVKALDTVAGGKRVRATTRLLRGDQGHLRLMQFSAPSADASAATIVPVQGPGITHVCYQSPDAKPMFPGIVAAGGRPVSRTGDLVQLRPDVPIKYAYLRDRDGVMLETEQIMLDNLPWTQRMRHVAIVATDIERTIDFYTRLLGKPPRERRSNLVNPTLDLMSGLDNVKLNVAWYQANNFELEVWQYLNPAPAPLARPRPVEALGYNMIVLDVANADLAARALTEAGGTLVARPAPMDGGRIAFGRDPDGTLIGLLQTPAASEFSTTRFSTIKP